MIEIELNYKIVISENPYCPGLSTEEAKKLKATNVKQVYIYCMVEYTSYSFSVRASLNECVLKEACGKLLRSDIVDEVEHEEIFELDDNGQPQGFGPGNITSRLISFIGNNSIGHEWLPRLRKCII